MHDLHAETVGRILDEVGSDTATIRRVQDLVRKRGLGRDAEVQVLEDALCLVFVETQLHDLAARLDADKMVDVARKTLVKMSADAIALVAEIDLADEDRVLLQRALSPA